MLVIALAALAAFAYRTVRNRRLAVVPDPHDGIDPESNIGNPGVGASRGAGQGFNNAGYAAPEDANTVGYAPPNEFHGAGHAPPEEFHEK